MFQSYQFALVKGVHDSGRVVIAQHATAAADSYMSMIPDRLDEPPAHKVSIPPTFDRYISSCIDWPVKFRTACDGKGLGTR